MHSWISRRVTATAAAAVLTGAFMAGCGSSGSGNTSSNPLTGGGGGPTGSIVVGSDNFLESVLLADIYGQALAAKGYKVSYKLNIASREVTYGLLKSGSITLKPEYNGALLAYLDSLSKKNTPQQSTEQVDAAIAQELAPNLEVLQPSSAQDNDTLTLSKQAASKYGMKDGSSITDFVAALKGGQVSIGAAAEFQTRYQGIVGLEQAYGLKPSQISFKSLDAGGTLTETALAQNAVDAGDLFTTDPTITQNGLVTLSDPKNIFGVQNVLPLVNKTALNPAGVAALNAVDAKLDSKTLLALDIKTQVQKQDPATVATAWLKEQGLV
ncbi:ABC transporter substrate-binding protein [Actinocrinis puniceicyclus]|uniref:ABC transporter substrate-binding protein n=1 Tax=Actinocrinis puniceicyclus TaxID=977794 RepID=A0A8J8BET5_9ACTN|nr:ABC transporter substrate-binding protein [Actinocrinis puniceicyclus]MBS2965496.1 ABC transporter substrate-binding protein [Actinocrinis puniceicyclus]